jgi:hypothetical protein
VRAWLNSVSAPIPAADRPQPSRPTAAEQVFVVTEAQVPGCENKIPGTNNFARAVSRFLHHLGFSCGIIKK